MPLVARLTGWLSLPLTAVLLAGIFRRHLYRICWWFAPYLAAVAIGNLLIIAWPGRFFTWEFFFAKETLYGVLKLAIVIEVAARIFAALPGAAATARVAILSSVLGTLLLIAVARPGMRVYDLAVELQPRLANGTVFVLLAVWFTAFYYQVPTHRFHRAILVGFGTYLLLFVVLLRLLAERGFRAHFLETYGDAASWLSLLAYWAWTAWSEEPADLAEAPVLQRLQPWRERLRS